MVSPTFYKVLVHLCWNTSIDGELATFERHPFHFKVVLIMRKVFLYNGA